MKVLGGEEEEERRGVDAAVVALVRELSGDGQLVLTHLVQDLARLLGAERVFRLALVAGEEAEGLAGDHRLEGQGLERGNDAIAAEEGGVPGRTGGDVALTDAILAP